MNATPVTADALPLVSVIVITEVAPGATLAGAKALATVGGVSVPTVSVAPAAAPVPALVEVTVPVEFT